MKIRKPYVDTCGVCFQFKLAIYKLQHTCNANRSRYMFIADDIHTDISHVSPGICDLSGVNCNVNSIPDHITLPNYNCMDVTTESVDLFSECQKQINSFDDYNQSNTFTCPYQDQIEKVR